MLEENSLVTEENNITPEENVTPPEERDTLLCIFPESREFKNFVTSLKGALGKDEPFNNIFLEGKAETNDVTGFSTNRFSLYKQTMSEIVNQDFAVYIKLPPMYPKNDGKTRVELHKTNDGIVEVRYVDCSNNVAYAVLRNQQPETPPNFHELYDTLQHDRQTAIGVNAAYMDDAFKSLALLTQSEHFSPPVVMELISGVNVPKSIKLSRNRGERYILPVRMHGRPVSYEHQPTDIPENAPKAESQPVPEPEHQSDTEQT